MHLDSLYRVINLITLVMIVVRSNWISQKQTGKKDKSARTEDGKQVSSNRNCYLCKDTLSDSATSYNKGYRRDIWSHGTNCTVSFSATPYSGEKNFTVAAMFLIT